MSANRACFPICVMARVLGVSKAGYYAWRHRPPSAHARADEVLLARIKTVHISSRQTYGAPLVHAELRAAGERHGGKRIARLMRAAGLVGASRRRGGPITTQRDKHARPAPDLVGARLPGRRPKPAVGRRHHPGLRRGRLVWGFVLSSLISRSEGSSPWRTRTRATHLYSAGPCRTSTMMQ